MPRIAVVFFSAIGATAKLADAVCSGAAELAEPVRHRIHGHDAQGRNRRHAQLGVVSQTINEELLTSDLLIAIHLGRQAVSLVNRLFGNKIANAKLSTDHP